MDNLDNLDNFDNFDKLKRGLRKERIVGSKTLIKPVSSGVGFKPKPRVSGFVPAQEIERPLPVSSPELLRQQAYEQQKAEAEAKVSRSTFVNDGRYVLLSDLPTRYLFYGYKELWIRPFTPNEARLLHMAKMSGNLTYIISAVAACLSQPITTLIIEDFEFCLYWLRMNSYPNRPFSVSWTCDNGECKHENVSVINKTNLTVDNLDSGLKIPSTIKYPTIAIFEQVWDKRRQFDSLNENDPGFESERDELLGDLYLMNVAQWLPTGESIYEKLDILKNSQDLDYQEKLEIEIAKLPDFGVSESLEVQCELCGGVTKRRLSLDYLTFFP